MEKFGHLPSDSADRLDVYGIAFIIVMLAKLAMFIGIGYIAIHFIIKFW